MLRIVSWTSLTDVWYCFGPLLLIIWLSKVIMDDLLVFFKLLRRASGVFVVFNTISSYTFSRFTYLTNRTLSQMWFASVVWIVLFNRDLYTIKYVLMSHGYTFPGLRITLLLLCELIDTRRFYRYQHHNLTSLILSTREKWYSLIYTKPSTIDLSDVGLHAWTHHFHPSRCSSS